MRLCHQNERDGGVWIPCSPCVKSRSEVNERLAARWRWTGRADRVRWSGESEGDGVTSPAARSSWKFSTSKVSLCQPMRAWLWLWRGLRQIKQRTRSPPLCADGFFSNRIKLKGDSVEDSRRVDTTVREKCYIGWIFLLCTVKVEPWQSSLAAVVTSVLSHLPGTNSLYWACLCEIWWIQRRKRCCSAL